jgi:glutathione reductase (NADPH)
LRGCDPKKVLVGAAEVIDRNHLMLDKGLGDNIKDIQIKWQELIRFKRTFTQPIPKNREEAFSKAGITSFHGTAHFISSSNIKVDNNGDNYSANISNNYNNNGNIINGRHILIASGSKPAKLNIPGEDILQQAINSWSLMNYHQRLHLLEEDTFLLNLHTL